MFLMKFTVFNEIIDEMVTEQGCMVAKDNFEYSQTEFIDAKKFK